MTDTAETAAAPSAMAAEPKAPGYDTCGATTRSGGHCRRPAGWGTNHVGAGTCKLHLGSTQSHGVAAARELDRRRVETALGAAGVLIAECFEDLADVPHAEALAESCQRAGTMERVFARMVDGLALDVGVGGLVGPDHLGDGRAHPFVNELARWQRQHAQLRKWALEAGIEERQVRLAEAEVDRLAEVLLAMWRSFRAAVEEGLSLDVIERERLPLIVRAAIETTGTEAA